MIKFPSEMPAIRLVLRSPRMFLAFGLGSGLSPLMPGTVGTIAAIPLYFLLAQLPWQGYLAALVIAVLIGNHICDFAARKLKVHDHSGIVWDEFVGFWLTMFLVPLAWQWVLLGFVLFRLFDMAKPWPISVVDKKVAGGVGIMLDDIIAALAAWLCLQSVILLW